MKVKPLSLMENFGNKSWLILVNGVVYIFFDFEDQLIPICFLMRWKRNESLGAIIEKGIVFGLHRIDPLRLCQSLFGSSRV